MAKASKQTKKFQNKHLKHTIEHRKKVQEFNKKAAKRKGKGGKGGDDSATATATSASASQDKNGRSKEVFDDVSVDEFLAGDFEIPKEKKRKTLEAKQKGNAKKSSNNNDDDGDDDDDEEEEDSSSEEDDEEDMKQNLENLEKEDPEFFKYLKENDKELLSVNPLDAISDDEDAEEEDAEEEEEEEEDGEGEVCGDDADGDAIMKGQDEERASGAKIEITTQLVKKWGDQLSKPTTKIIRNIVIAFKAAMNINKGEDYKYAMVDPQAFADLMIIVLKKVPLAIENLVKYKTNVQGVRTVPQKNSQAGQIATILKTHASSYITLLKDITNTESAALILASLYEVFPYYLSHRRLLKQILTAVVDVWASANQVDTQIAAFAFLNNVVREYPKSILETVLKLTYSSFLQHCRRTNIHTIDRLNFCKNSSAELYGIDETIGYQIGFEYVRQLAIHLRNSINATSNAKEGYKTVYNWQFCHSLDFWSRVLSQLCNPEIELKHKSKESPMRQLIYPLVQVTLGTIKLIPTAQFFPLRFYLLRSLIRLSQLTGVYIPLFPLLFEILSSTAITKPPKASTLQMVDFEHNIKVNQAYLGTRVYQDGLTEQFIELTAEFFGLYAKNVAFPELITPAVLGLKRFTKKSKNVKFNKQLGQLIEKLNANAQFITTRRAKVEYGPSNKQEVKTFLSDYEWAKTPLGQYITVQRQLKEERLKMLREAQEEESKALEAKKHEDSE